MSEFSSHVCNSSLKNPKMRRKRKYQLTLNRMKSHRKILKLSYLVESISEDRTQAVECHHSMSSASPFKTPKRASLESPSEFVSKYRVTPSNTIPLSSLGIKKTHKRKKKTRKGRQLLFSPRNDNKDACVKELCELAENLVYTLEKHGHLQEFMSLIRLISSKHFPMDNIAFLLLLEVARWYSLPSTNQMTYSESTKLFWRVGLKLFHGGFIRFMSGGKSEGQFLEGGEACALSPHDAHINFAIPDISTLRDFSACKFIESIPAEMPPGIMHESIQLKAADNPDVSYVLSVDGKKIAPGLNYTFGDEDLFGHEKPNLAERKQQLQSDLAMIQSARNTILGGSLPTNEKTEMLYSLVHMISKWIRELRNLKVKHTFALKKFLKWGGPDWRKSKYLHAISSTQASLHQVKLCINELLSANNKLLQMMATTNNSSIFVTSGEVDLSLQNNCCLLKDPANLTAPVPLPICKQRSTQWFEVRKAFKVTGSTLYPALGLDGLKNQQLHILKVTQSNAAEEEPTPDALRFMQHGTANEINAVATLAGKVLPAIMPSMQYYEEGAHIVKGAKNESLILASPDGSIRRTIDRSDHLPPPTMAVEIKCPFPADYKTPVQYMLPARYVTQVLAEMVSLDVERLLFLSWCEESMAVFVIKFDQALWDAIMEEVCAIYSEDKIQKPTKCREGSKTIKALIKSFQHTHVTFIMEVPSAKAKPQQNVEVPTHPSHFAYLCPQSQTQSAEIPSSDLDGILSEVQSALNNSFQLSRKKAVEVLVWLLSDTNRMWQPEMPHSLPIAYGLKGYSLPVDVMRGMCDEVIQACHSKGIHVACLSFDGQWLPMANRSATGKPLTLLQLQRDVWQKVKGMTKEDLIQTLVTTAVSDGIATKEENSICMNSNFMQKCNQFLHKGLAKCDVEISQENDDCISYLSTEAIEVFHEESQEHETNAHSEVNCTPGEVQITPHKNSVKDISMADLNAMLTKLQTHSQATIRTKWENLGETNAIEKIRSSLENAKNLALYSVKELDIILECTKDHQESYGISLKKSWNKADKVNGLSLILGNNTKLDDKEKTIKGPIQKLSYLAAKVLSSPKSKLSVYKSPSKEILNVVAAFLLYPQHRSEWEKHSPLKKGLKLAGLDNQMEWFSYPEFNERRNQLEPKCLDSHHLLVNCRVKVCKDGFPGYGISRDAWIKVAESDATIISKALVEDLLDKQSNGFAKRTFSAEVENKMLELGYHNEANFCHLIRCWYEAEDEKGLSAMTRVQKRLELKTFLLAPLDFTQFPPYGTHIMGMPRTMLEGFIQGIDTKIQLYGIVKGNSYNARAIGSLQNETFFGEMTEMEQTRQGCPKAINIPRIMSTVTELMHYRHNPNNRVFKMRTARNPMYPNAKLDGRVLQTSTSNSPTVPPVLIRHIDLKDHFFDMPDRCRRKTRKSKASDISKPNHPARGCQTIRRTFFQFDESSVLATKRLGIEMNDSL